MALRWRRQRRVLLCPIKKSAALELGNHVVYGRFFFLDYFALGGELDFVAGLFRLLPLVFRSHPAAGIFIRRHVGYRQCQLRADHALPWHVDGNRYRHWDNLDYWYADDAGIAG